MRLKMDIEYSPLFVDVIVLQELAHPFGFCDVGVYLEPVAGKVCIYGSRDPSSHGAGFCPTGSSKEIRFGVATPPFRVLSVVSCRHVDLSLRLPRLARERLERS